MIIMIFCKGVIGAKVGKVEAIDSDANQNAEVTYRVS